MMYAETLDDLDLPAISLGNGLISTSPLQGSDLGPTESRETSLQDPSTSRKSHKYKGKGKGKRSNHAENGKKEAVKQQQADDKAAKRAAIEANKIYKPGECMKYMSVEAHPGLLGAWYMSDVGREVAAAGAKLSPSSSLCDQGLVVWTRCLPPRLTADNGQVGLTPKKQPCNHSLYVTQPGDIQELVAEHRLAEHVAMIKQLVGTELTLVLFGVKDFFKASSRKTLNSNKKLMNEIDLEMAITDVLVTAGCDTVCVETPNELALFVVQITKAIAEEPFKKSKRAVEEQAEFYMAGDNKNCIAVDNDGNGLARLWQQMMAVLPKSSLEVSRAICSQCPSPVVLSEVLETNTAGVADIGVSRAAGPGAKARRLGPEFARKLHTLFTSPCGDVFVN